MPSLYLYTCAGKSSTGRPHVIGLHFIALHRYCGFVLIQIEGCGNPVSSKSMDAIFPTAFVLSVSLVSHVSNSRSSSNFSIIIKFVMVICDQ